jgi:hypothetical protein
VKNPDPKPTLQRVLEEVCSSMRLDKGRHRLELVFVDGRLDRFWAHAENRPARELALYDENKRHD